MNRFSREAIIMGLLPVLVIVVGLIAGLIAPRLFGQVGAGASEGTITPVQETLLSELAACLRSLSARVKSTLVSQCAEKDATPLIGIARATLANRLGRADWCEPGPTGQFLPWSDRVCARAPIWGYSFYRLPTDAIGGGPEVRLAFDETQRTASASWVHTQ
jgi:hypothetical protein